MVMQEMLELIPIQSLGKFPLILLHLDLLFFFLLLDELFLDHPDGCIYRHGREREENDRHVEDRPPGNFISQAVDRRVLHHAEKSKNDEESQNLQPNEEHGSKSVGVSIIHDLEVNHYTNSTINETSLNPNISNISSRHLR